MSLQSAGSIHAFAGRMYRAWCVWDNVAAYAQRNNFAAPPHPAGAPPGLGLPAAQMRTFRRKELLIRAINDATSFMPRLTIAPAALGAGTFGRFDYRTWQMQVDQTLWGNMNIDYPDFVELCLTLYHEARHAEQFYRIAQGLACGQLDFRRGGPTGNELAQMHATPAAGGGGVQARIAQFTAMHNVNNQVITPDYLAQRTFLPVNVATAAMQNARVEFDAYLRRGCPNWFTKNTALAEVNEWYSSFYTRYNRRFTHFSQPQEHDAHSIETPVRNAMLALIGVQPRANGFARARSDNDFNHLPTA